MIAVGRPRTLSGGQGEPCAHSFGSVGSAGAAQTAPITCPRSVHTSPACALLPVSIQTQQILTSAVLCSQEVIGDLIQRICALVCDPEVSPEASHPHHAACVAHACVTPTLTRTGLMPPSKKASFTRRKGVHAERSKPRETGMGAPSKRHARTLLWTNMQIQP